MPNRIIRDSILTSASVSSLGWAEEVFYRRLMSVVDDYGRCESMPQLLRARCYPLQTDQVRVADISRWMAACQKAGLVVLYEIDGKQYLQVEKFGQQQRSASKCPAPPAVASNCKQTLSNAPVFVSVSEGVSVSAPDGALFDRFYAAYPKKKAPADARKAFDKTGADEALLLLMLKAIEAQKATEEWQREGGKFIPYPASWLNSQRWLDEVGVTVDTSSVSRAVEAEAAAREAERLAQLARARSPEAEAARKAAMAHIRRAA